MMAEIGVWLLAVATVLALWPLLPVRLGGIRSPSSLATICTLQFATILAAMAVLISLFVDSDFSVSLVAAHSHTQKPMMFKVAAAWGQHEGSMLLWALVLSGMGAWWAARHGEDALTPLAVRIQSALLLATLAFILFTSNPFSRLWVTPQEGDGLNPLLQDVGLALHPPLLYLGYVGLSLVFSLAVAAMQQNRLDAAWARQIRPWVLMPWAFLTLGIGLGSWWAYRELGWGGWWFWDPVENASFIPWLIATALFHSVIVLEKRGSFARWVALLATLGFATSLLGTFLVRSGVLTSVHAFATDPARGVYILVFLASAVGYAFFVYGRFSLYQQSTTQSQPVALTSRTHALLLNNLLLIVIAATVLTGTLYPVILQALAAPSVSVGAPYYLATLSPLAGLLLLLGGIAPLLGWPGTSLRMLSSLAVPVVLVAILIIAIQWPSINAAIGVALGMWFALGALPALRHSRSLRTLGMVLSHMAFGIFIASACVNHATKQEHAALLKVGQSTMLGTTQISLRAIHGETGSNYFSRIAEIEILPEHHATATRLHAEEREYPTEQQKTNEAAIASDVAGDWYAVAQFQDDGNVQIRFMREPMLPTLWLSLALMALGGVCSCMAGFGRKNKMIQQG